MLLGPKYKICKRLGASVFEKCQTKKFQLAEARAPRRTRPKRGGGGDYGAQLLEKQKARLTYGMGETQFARYVHEAMEQHRVPSSENLLSRLESRLDNTVYRAGFVSTRRAARQMVSHGHIFVNGRRMNIPSHCVKEGDVVSVRPESRESALFTGRSEAALETKTPVWLKSEDGGFAVAVASAPGVGQSEAPFSAPIIIQFYSR